MRTQYLVQWFLKSLVCVVMCMAFQAASSQLPVTTSVNLARQASVFPQPRAGGFKAARLPATVWETILSQIQPEVAQASPFDLAQALDPWLEQIRVSPEGSTLTEQFGYSVDVDEEYVVVGAYSYNARGAAYVFHRYASGWPSLHQIARLTPSSQTLQGIFGWVVDIDGGTIAVSAPGEDGYKGAVYIFIEPEHGWVDKTENAKLTASDRYWSDYFGFSMALDHNQVVVGAPFNDHISEDHGAVYTFIPSPYGWMDQTEANVLYGSSTAEGESYGGSVAIDSGKIVVGAHAENNGAGIGSGKAYVYGDWGAQIAQLTASDTTSHEYFGRFVDIDGDLIAVGAPGETSYDNNGHEAVYLFYAPGESWGGNLTETAILTASDGMASDEFGYRIATDGDVVMVGAFMDDYLGFIDNGSVYTYEKPETGWISMTESSHFTAGDTYSGDHFANSLSLNGNALVVGAPDDHVGDPKTGSAYVFLQNLLIFLPVVIR